jgi:acyl carrier protein
MRSTDVYGSASTSARLLAIWEEILNQPGLSTASHFFESGATSLSVVMLTGRISDIFNVELSPNDISDHPILAQQVKLVDGSVRQEKVNSVLVDAHAWRKREGAEKPGLAQCEILEKPAETPAYLENVVMAFFIRGGCSEDGIREAFRAVLQQQPSLRCSFELSSNGQWRRVQHALDEFPYQRMSLAIENRFSRAVDDIVVEHSMHAIDLKRPPLIRATYIECPGADDILIITAHHIAFDGWSGAVLMDQLCAHYQSFLTTGAPCEAKHYLQYADYTDAQHQRLAENLLDEHNAFWREKLRQLPEPFPLHGAVQRPRQFTFRSAVLPLNLDAHYPAIAHMCSRTGFSLYIVILTAFLVSLARNTDVSDVYVRSPVANRTDASLEPVVGYFVHPMIIRPGLTEWVPSLRLLEQVNQCVSDAYGHTKLPPSVLEEHCSPRSADYGSRFPYWYNHHNYPSSQRQLGTSLLDPIGVPPNGIKTDVSLGTLRTANGLIGSFTYSRDAIGYECAQALMESFRQALSELLAIEGDGEP